MQPAYTSLVSLVSFSLPLANSLPIDNFTFKVNRDRENIYNDGHKINNIDIYAHNNNNNKNNNNNSNIDCNDKNNNNNCNNKIGHIDCNLLNNNDNNNWNNTSNFESRDKNDLPTDEINKSKINKIYQIKNKEKEAITQELSSQLESLVQSFYEFQKILDFDPKLVRK